jgi:rubrerythrin
MLFLGRINWEKDFMSKTDENLRAAVAGESLARNRYSYFAEMAKKEGYRYIAKIFEEIAENEKYHAMEELKLLMGDRDTLTNLRESVNGEQYESEDMYPLYATEAEVEGNRAATILFRNQSRTMTRWKKR